MENCEEKQETRVERSELFAIDKAPPLSLESEPITSLAKLFDFDFKSYIPSTSQAPVPLDPSEPILNEFNLFSTGSGPIKISLSETAQQIPLVNTTRPREYYFTDPTDKERISKLRSVAVTGSQILELSSRPWAAKRNPRLLTTISACPEKIKKRRKPSKKERDYKKKMKLVEEKRVRDERRYEKFLKYGQTQRGLGRSSRGGVSGGTGRGVRGRGVLTA